MRSSPRCRAGWLRQASATDRTLTCSAAQRPYWSRQPMPRSTCVRADPTSTVQAQATRASRSEVRPRATRTSPLSTEFVAGGHRPVPLEPVDPALHRVAQLVSHRVEGRWPAAGAAPGPPVGGLVVLLGDDRADAAAAQQRPVGPAAVGLVGQHPVGPGAGPPRAHRGTRIPSSTVWNWGLSPRWPAVTTIDSGRWPPSTARCSLVVSPPRERPSPWSAGSLSTPPGSSRCRSPPCERRRRAGGRGRRWCRR